MVGIITIGAPYRIMPVRARASGRGEVGGSLDDRWSVGIFLRAVWQTQSGVA